MLDFALIFYGPLILVSYAILFWRHGFDLVHPEPVWLGWTLVAALFALAVVFFSRWAGGRFAWARDMESEFLHVLGPLTTLEVVALALLSGVGEEAFFRGVLQPKIGFFWASLVFGSVHVPFSIRLVPWTIFAWLMGLALGLLYSWSGSLIPPMAAHALINGINLYALANRARQLGISRRAFTHRDDPDDLD